GRVLEAGHHGLVMAEVSGKIDDANPRVLAVKVERAFEGIVRRSGVDEDDFKRGRDTQGSPARTRVEVVHVRPRPVQGCDDRQIHQVVACPEQLRIADMNCRAFGPVCTSKSMTLTRCSNGGYT